MVSQILDPKKQKWQLHNYCNETALKHTAFNSCFPITLRWMIHPHTVNAFYDRVTNKISEYQSYPIGYK